MNGLTSIGPPRAAAPERAKGSRLETRILPPSALSDVAPAWRAWLARVPDATFLDSPEYASFAWRDSPANYWSGLVALALDGQDVGYVPFRWQKQLFGLPTGRFRAIGLGAHAPGLAPEDAQRALVAAASLLGASSVEIDAPIAGAAPPLLPGHHAPTIGAPRSVVDTLELGASWERFVEAQSSRFRRHLRYGLHQAQAKGWVLDEPREDEAGWMERANDLLELSLNEAAGLGRGRAIRIFARHHALRETFQGGGLRIFVLRRGARVASVIYGVQWQGAFHLFRQGNDPTAAKQLRESASLVARAMAFRQLTQEGVHQVHVVDGTTGPWRANPIRRVTITYARRGLGGAARRAAHAALLRLGRFPAVRVLRSHAGRMVPALAKHGA